MERDERITIRVPAELKAQLQAAAAADGRKLSNYIVRLLTLALAEGEQKSEG